MSKNTLLPFILLIAIAFPVHAFSQHADLPFPNSHFDTIDGVSVHYRLWEPDQPDPGKKIVLIHGYAGSTFCFRNVYDTLVALGYTVVAVDIPGAGYSDRTLDFNQSHSHRAKFLWDLLFEIEPEDSSNWTILGHSMGGGTAEAMAILHPDKTRKLIIVSGAIFRKTNNLTNTATFALRQKPIRNMLINYTDNNIITYKRFNKLLKSAYKRKPDSTEVMGYLTPLLQEGSAASLINIYINNKEDTVLDVRTLEGVPVLAVWGTRDSWVPLRTVRMSLDAFPDVTLVKMKGAGHMPMETHPDQFMKPFVAFLKE